MTVSVFIDGAVGTTGLEIAERLAGRDDMELVTLGEDRRKDSAARAEALRGADFAILCLPDDASKEAALLAQGSNVRLIDASSAHRVAPGWTYGFAEMVAGQRAAIAAAKYVSNPGCYPTGFLAFAAPLIAAGLLPRDYPYVVHAVSGYSGGGKSLIARFEDDATLAWRGYGFAMGHKHVPEMTQHAGLTHAPIFAPAVIPAHRGMAVELPLSRAADPRIAPADEIIAALTAHYAGSPLVSVSTDAPDGELLLRQGADPSDRLDLKVFASPDGTQLRLVALLDNLGKGASGACVQSLNIMAGLPETAGLRL
jgi:N-acetyl-gamma-glutamyl-phosphate reductase